MTEWCYEFNFKTSTDASGWGPTPGQPVANFVQGTGWRSVPGYNGKVVYITSPIFALTLVKEVQLTFTWDTTPQMGMGLCA
jgi:hypothetical protein